MLDVDGVEADDGRVQTDVGFGDTIAVVEWARAMMGEMSLDAVEGGEKGLHGRLVGGLRPTRQRLQINCLPTADVGLR